MSKVIGIDLGTTNSCVSVLEHGEPLVIPNDEGSRTTPSVVAFTREGDRLVGQIARRQAVTNASRTVSVAKRLIGRRYDDDEVQKSLDLVSYTIDRADNGDAWIQVDGKSWSPQQISAIVLEKMKAIAEAYLSEKVTEAVVTVPAYFNDAQRQATKDAGRIAGLDILRIINEPTAAALAYGLGRRGHERVAVFDLGGGTFDVSILEIDNGVFEVRSTNGDTFLGGEDFDNRITSWLVEQFAIETGVSLVGDPVAMQRIKEAAEKAKHELSSTTETEIHLPFVTATPSGPLHLMAELSRARLEGLCADLIDRLEGPCRQALSDARLKPANLDAILLVGGMTRMPRVQEKVAQIFGKAPERGINPDEVVAVGAAIQGSVLKGEVKDVLLLDVTPLSLGIETAGGLFESIIPRNSAIPCRKSKVFTTAQDNQDMVRVHILQGEREFSDDNKSLGHLEMHGLPPAPRGLPEIEVTFELDANGILLVKARDKGTGKAQSLKVISNSGLSDGAIEQMIGDAEQFRDHDAERRNVAESRNRLDGLIYTTRRSLDEYSELLDVADDRAIRDALTIAERAMTARDRATVAHAHEGLAVAAQRIAESIYASARNGPSSDDHGGNGPTLALGGELVDDE
ncbi:MAG: molecular chaperone DnaK [Pseudomonadota bacterium]|nr:molecular chaperone DnaK [Pseudomonadota bacterium]